MASTKRNTPSPPPQKKKQKQKQKQKHKNLKTWDSPIFSDFRGHKKGVRPSVRLQRKISEPDLQFFFFFLHEVHKARNKMTPDFVKKTEIRKCIHLSTGNRLLIKWSLKSWWSKYFVSGMFVAVRLLDTHTSGP